MTRGNGREPEGQSEFAEYEEDFRKAKAAPPGDVFHLDEITEDDDDLCAEDLDG